MHKKHQPTATRKDTELGWTHSWQVSHYYKAVWTVFSCNWWTTTTCMITLSESSGLEKSYVTWGSMLKALFSLLSDAPASAAPILQCSKSALSSTPHLQFFSVPSSFSKRRRNRGQPNPELPVCLLRTLTLFLWGKSTVCTISLLASALAISPSLAGSCCHLWRCGAGLDPVVAQCQW